MLGAVDAIMLGLQTEITQLGRKTFVQSINPEKAYGRLKSYILPRFSSYLVLDAIYLDFTSP